MKSLRNIILIALAIGSGFWALRYAGLGKKAAALDEAIREEVLAGAGRFDDPANLAYRIVQVADRHGIDLAQNEISVRYLSPDQISREGALSAVSELVAIDGLFVVELDYVLTDSPVSRSIKQRLEKPVAGDDQPYTGSAPPPMARAVDPGAPSKDIGSFRQDVQRAIGQ